MRIAAFFITFRKLLIQAANTLLPEKIRLPEMIQSQKNLLFLNTALELNIAEIIGDGTISVNEIAQKTQTRPDPLYRFLRTLAGEGIFSEKPEKCFSNSKASHFLRSDRSDNIKAIVMHQSNPQILTKLLHIRYSLENAEPVSTLSEGPYAFDALAENPTENKNYNEAMSNATHLLCNVILHYFPFEKYKTIADLGGGNGLLAARILKKSTNTVATVADFAHVISHPDPICMQDKLQERINFVSVNLLEPFKIAADLYVMKNVLHAFGDDDCLTILKHTYETAPKESHLLIIEMALGKANTPSQAKIFDMQMLALTRKGRERTTNEYRKLVESAGFTFKKEIQTVSPFSLFLAEKTNSYL